MIQHRSEIRVRYADTDQMKVVHHGKYFEYFELGRSDLMRAIGVPYPEIEAMGLFLPVIEAQATYKQAARYDDLLHIVTYFREMPSARIKLDYEVLNASNNELVAEGYTVHTFIKAESGKPTRAPAQFLQAISRGFKLADPSHQTPDE